MSVLSLRLKGRLLTPLGPTGQPPETQPSEALMRHLSEELGLTVPSLSACSLTLEQSRSRSQLKKASSPWGSWVLGGGGAERNEGRGVRRESSKNVRVSSDALRSGGVVRGMYLPEVGHVGLAELEARDEAQDLLSPKANHPQGSQASWSRTSQAEGVYV